MTQEFKRFIFEDYTFWPKEKKLVLKYSLDEKLFFEEQIIFDFEFDPNFNRIAFGKAIFGIFVMCGISYFKAFLPPKIEFRTRGLSPSQAKFFQKTWERGLREFFYRNNIDPKGKINFPYSSGFVSQGYESKNLSGSLVPLGGGKDSLVTTELLKEAGKDFETWTVGTFPFLEPMIERIGVPHLPVKRILDPQLFELNDKGALNGHVPISAILAFLGVTSAILRGRKNIILSNENSANEPTTGNINHQYSKSIAFEQDFQKYVEECISPDVHYFSLLRPFSEFKIAELFVKKCWEKYSKLFMSCNTNYKLITKNSQLPHWCGKCPKCAFVFAIFAPFVEREKLIALFGKNLFEDPTLTNTFEELLGLRETKPFECVGEIEEVRYCFEQAKKNFPEVLKFKFPTSRFDAKKIHISFIPTKFKEIFKKSPL